MPTEVGKISTINVYGVYANSCRALTKPLRVMRCSLSTEYDLVYKYGGQKTDSCSEAFCGMF